ncbi:MAG: hypothetical protein MUQ56_13680, partial [Thermoleophilia bacterium]|nr:hypothetical protein [Thermoleophilia bacterium]
ASAWMAVRALDDGRFPKALYLLLGIGTLIRIDAAVPMLTVLIFMLLFDARHRKDHAVWGITALISFLGGQTLLRWAYYGDWLPNTYYLKMTGYPSWLRIRRGWSVLVDFVKNLKAPLAFLPLAALIRLGDRRRWLLVWIICAELAYSVYVGGDAWESRGGANRFIATVMPLFMVLYMAGWHELSEMVAAFLVGAAERVSSPQTVRRWVSRVVRWGGIASIGLVSAVSLLYFNRVNNEGSLLIALREPRQGLLKYAFLLERSIFVPGTERYTKDALILRRVTTSDARIAVVAAGNTPYFSNRFSIDILGKSDRKIARETARIPADADSALLFRPGHIKWDYAYSIGALAPDVVVEPFRDSYDEARPYLAGYVSVEINGHPAFFRKGSQRVLWSALEEYR